MERFDGTLGFLLRVLAVYRKPVLECLAEQCDNGLHVLAGRPSPHEAVTTTDKIIGADVNITRNKQFLKGPLRTWWQQGIKQWVERVDPDVLVMEANPRLWSSRWVRKWMHKRGRPVLAWGIGLEMQGKGYEKIRTMGRDKFLRGFDGIVAYGERARSEYETFGFPKDRLFVARNAVTRRPTNPLPQRPDSFNGQPVILFVGRLLPRKRVENLIKACAALPVDKKPRLRIVGSGDTLEELKSLATSIFPSTEFLGEKRGEELDDIWKQADLFVLPGMGGLAIQESMAWGLPVIVAEGDGTQFDLVRPENGWHVEPGNVEALASLLNQAFSDAAQLRRMGEASYRIVSQEINIEAMIESFIHGINTIQKMGLR